MSTCCGAFKVVRDLVIRPEGRVSAMPSSPIGVNRRIGSLGERPVRILTLLRRRCLIDRGAHERMTERGAIA
jgi:hypothetical protein